MKLTFLLGLVVITACSPTQPSAAARASHPAPAASASMITGAVGKGSPAPLLPLSALRPTLTSSVDTTPVLVPTALPDSGFSVRVTTDRGYQVMYWRPAADMWSIQVGCFDGPDPARSAVPERTFRGAPAALVRGYDKPNHLTLEWMEPGATGCHDFFLSAYVVDDGDFWRLADSLTAL